MFEVNKSEQFGAWITWHEDKWYLHSNGEVLSTPEYWPTRTDAETILAKYPDAAPPVVEPPPHEWVHGDVFELDSFHLVYIKPKAIDSEPQAFCIESCVGPALDLAIHLKDAKFLFNISDAVKERQAAIDAESSDEVIVSVPVGRERAGLVSVAEMQEFVAWVADRTFCDCGQPRCNIHDRLANRFEKVLAQIEDER
jgi:hypothetical protein